MGNNFSSKYELFRNVKADDKKGLNKNYGIFLVLRRKTGLFAQEIKHHHGNEQNRQNNQQNYRYCVHMSTSRFCAAYR